MSILWNRSSRKDDDDWTPIAGETPTEVAANFAATVNTAGMSEADLCSAMVEAAECYSDNQQEQMEYLLSLKQALREEKQH